jgi:hypothetical protein
METKRNGREYRYIDTLCVSRILRVSTTIYPEIANPLRGLCVKTDTTTAYSTIN